MPDRPNTCPECIEKDERIEKLEAQLRSSERLGLELQAQLVRSEALDLKLEPANFGVGSMLIVSLDGEEVGRLFIKPQLEKTARAIFGVI